MGIFRGVWLFQKNISVKKLSPSTQITFYKYNEKSIFGLFKTCTEPLQIFLKNFNYIGAYQKTAFGFNFELESKSSFLIKSYVITIFFCVCFGPYEKVKKNNFLLYFSKLICVGRTLLCAKKNSEKAKHSGICPSFGGKVGET